MIQAGRVDGGGHGFRRDALVAIGRQARLDRVAQAQRDVAHGVAIVLGDIAFGIDLVLQRPGLVIDLVTDRSRHVPARHRIAERVEQHVRRQRDGRGLLARGDAAGAVDQQVVGGRVVQADRREDGPHLAARRVVDIARGAGLGLAVRLGARQQIAQGVIDVAGHQRDGAIGADSHVAVGGPARLQRTDLRRALDQQAAGGVVLIGPGFARLVDKAGLVAHPVIRIGLGLAQRIGDAQETAGRVEHIAVDPVARVVGGQGGSHVGGGRRAAQQHAVGVAAAAHHIPARVVAQLRDKTRRVDLVYGQTRRAIDAAAAAVLRVDTRQARRQRRQAQLARRGAGQRVARHRPGVLVGFQQIADGVIGIAHHAHQGIDHQHGPVGRVEGGGGDPVLGIGHQGRQDGAALARHRGAQPGRVADHLHGVAIGVQHLARDRARGIHAGDLAMRAVVDPVGGAVLQAALHRARIAASRHGRGVLDLPQQVAGGVIDVLGHRAQAVHDVSQAADAVVGIQAALIARGVGHARQRRVDGRRRQRHVGRHARGVGDPFHYLAIGVVALAHHGAGAIHLQDGMSKRVVDRALALVVGDIHRRRGRHLGRAHAGGRQAVGIGDAFAQIAGGVVLVGHHRTQRVHRHRQPRVGAVVTVLGPVRRLRRQQRPHLRLAGRRSQPRRRHPRGVTDGRRQAAGGVIAALAHRAVGIDLQDDPSRRIQHITRDVAVAVHGGDQTIGAVVHARDRDVTRRRRHAGRIAARRQARGVADLCQQVAGRVIGVPGDGAGAVHDINEPARGVMDVDGELVARGIGQRRQRGGDRRLRHRRAGRNAGRVGHALDHVAVAVVALAHHAAQGIHLEDRAVQRVIDRALALVVDGVGLRRGRHLRGAYAGGGQAGGVGDALGHVAVAVIGIADHVARAADRHRQATAGGVIAVFRDVGGIWLEQAAQLEIADGERPLQIHGRDVGHRPDHLAGGVIAGLDHIARPVDRHRRPASVVVGLIGARAVRRHLGQGPVIQVIHIARDQRQSRRIQRLGITPTEVVVAIPGYHAVGRGNRQLLTRLVVGISGHQLQAGRILCRGQHTAGLVERHQGLASARLDGLILAAERVVAVLRQQLLPVGIHQAAQAPTQGIIGIAGLDPARVHGLDQTLQIVVTVGDRHAAVFGPHQAAVRVVRMTRHVAVAVAQLHRLPKGVVDGRHRDAVRRRHGHAAVLRIVGVGGTAAQFVDAPEHIVEGVVGRLLPAPHAVRQHLTAAFVVFELS